MLTKKKMLTTEKTLARENRAAARPLTQGLLFFWLSLGLVAAATPALAIDPQGFIYGQITTRSGTTYEGRLRWDGEEAFWGDLFHASKEDLPYVEEIPEKERRRREPFKIFGITLGVNWNSSGGRQFIARFGDLREIRTRRGDHATVVMQNGTEYELDGGGDVDETIVVWDASIGEVELDWDNIRRIKFLPTPATLKVPVERLYGVVKTTEGELRGFIQWDKQECLSSDKLDGESRDGDMSIPMGNLRAIERRSRKSSVVTLEDGRELVLDGTNDVDDDNRGIYVEGPPYGRVLVTWDAFERVDFLEPPGSGPSYEEFQGAHALRGKVITRDGTSHRGRIIYDVDESETWEHLSGDWRDLTYEIPFSLISAIAPRDRDSSRVFLKSGEELVLEGSVDVNQGNAGIVVLQAEGKPVYVPWDQVKRVEFDS